MTPALTELSASPTPPTVLLTSAIPARAES